MMNNRMISFSLYSLFTNIILTFRHRPQQHMKRLYEVDGNVLLISTLTQQPDTLPPGKNRFSLKEQKASVEKEAARLLSCHEEGTSLYSGVEAILNDVISDLDFEHNQTQKFPSLALEFAQHALGTIEAAIEDLHANCGIQDTPVLYSVKRNLKEHVEKLEQQEKSDSVFRR